MVVSITGTRHTHKEFSFHALLTMDPATVPQFDRGLCVLNHVHTLGLRELEVQNNNNDCIILLTAYVDTDSEIDRTG